MRGESNPALERLVSQETVAEILRMLTPSELVVALLRADGLSDREIGEFLGVGGWVPRQRMIRARERIERMVPGAAEMLKGRTRRPVERAARKAREDADRC